VTSQDRVPLFVRLPESQAAALDRLVDSTGRRKQQVVSELLGEQLGVGRIEVSEVPPALDAEVLTLEEVAELLRVPTRLLRRRMGEDGPPGRSFGGDWRFARAAVMEWLAAGEAPGADPPQDDA
jgi:excisionase family DNA binding protein